jgi:hypothetical protein
MEVLLLRKLNYCIVEILKFFIYTNINKYMNKVIFTVGIFFLAFAYILLFIDNYNYVYAQGKPDFITTLSGNEVVPPIKTLGTGIANFEVLDNFVNYQINILDTGNITSIQIHNGTIGTNGESIITLFKSKNNSTNLTENITGISSAKQRSSSFSISGSFDASDFMGTLTGKTLNDLVLSMLEDETYVNVSTQNYLEGELRGQILENEG